MITLSVFCVVLFLGFGVATPRGSRFRESSLQNEGNKEFQAERYGGEPRNPYNTPNKQNEEYEQFNTGNNPAAFRNVNEQSAVIPENKEYNQITAERNGDNFNDESSRPSYIASLPQENRINTFRPTNREYHKANIPRKVDILSEVNDPQNDSIPNESNVQIIQERNSANHVVNKFNRQNSEEPENMYDKKEKEADFIQYDVPAATPEYVKSLFNDFKHPQLNNVKSTDKILPRKHVSNKIFQTNVNEATFQNPSAELLYETGQAQPYEINDEPTFKSQRANRHAPNILNNKQKLKNLYLSSKPTKHFMVVYPDGRVEQVDNLDKIQKKHPNYVMLSAKELLRNGNLNRKVSTGSQGSVVKHNSQITATTMTPTTTTTTATVTTPTMTPTTTVATATATARTPTMTPTTTTTTTTTTAMTPTMTPTTTMTTMKPQLNSIENTKDDQIDTVPQTGNEQILPYPIEPLPVSTEAPTTSSDVTKTFNVTKYREDKVHTKLSTEKDIQDQFQESEINDSQEKNKSNDYEVTNPGSVVTVSDISGSQVSTSSTNTPDIEDTVTTVRSTISTPTEATEIIDKTVSNFLTTNNTESNDLTKEREDEKTDEKNYTTTSDLINTKYESVVADENTTPTPKRESNEEDKRTKETKTVILENSNTSEDIETSNKNYEIITRNTSQSSDSSSNKEESNFITKSSNDTVITFEDGTSSDGKTFHRETIIIDYDNESSAQNSRSNNVTSTEDSVTLVSNSNITEITNSPTENTENNTNPSTVSPSNPLTNSTLDFSEKDENNTDTITIPIVSKVTNSELDGNKNDDKADINSDTIYIDASSNKSLGEADDVNSTKEESNKNKSVIVNVQEDSPKYTDGDDTAALPTGNQNVLNEDVADTAADAKNDFIVISQDDSPSLNEEDTTASDTASDDSYYLTSPQGLIEDDEDDVTREEIPSEITNNDNIETESLSSNGDSVNQPSFWFNASDTFWNKLLNNNEHNSFYFLFPRPKPNTIETKKTIYPNGTTVVETIETVDKGDGETISSKTIFKCGNCTTCEKTL